MGPKRVAKNMVCQFCHNIRNMQHGIREKENTAVQHNVHFVSARRHMRSPAHMIPAELPLSKHTWHSSEKRRNVCHSKNQCGEMKCSQQQNTEIDIFSTIQLLFFTLSWSNKGIEAKVWNLRCFFSLKAFQIYYSINWMGRLGCPFFHGCAEQM